ncbi:nicotinate-nucleotide pyrophosphorylase [carboxylating] [Desulfacinum hydrothermale DSM 13146]|uniref:Probable nicotinate-nucleotide pyrophosphorylase [carboxylating] n=1 Tax=Desulfacinum hydrothermale DSM 13146 TaxID=1121390 RepID=A0A1W1X4E3_9BACT|nr:carboxylating nicotinate-nucleotide diphosphorylase [Desulfacinum hydrothermale]SMC18766.1 nicotinate-nucleotide pyrophosphorylase [carboxylating] [Desulfacinum hydrothermale DSM 13146]
MFLTVDERLRLALQEDVGSGDVTTSATVPEDRVGQARAVLREPCVLSGLEVFERVFNLVDRALEIQSPYRDGNQADAQAVVAVVRGRLASILTGERTALNLLQRLCGIATLTHRLVQAVAGTPCRILDTRKTTPLWRDLEKKAVHHGGGKNHRFGLFDGILIKDNHVAAAGGVRAAIQRARQAAPHTLRVEVEVDSLEQLQEALDARADVIMLDNFSVDQVRRGVELAAGRALLEVSGGVTLETVRAYAETGVDFISVGALTHSAPAIDISLEVSA